MNKRDEIILQKILKYCAEIQKTHSFFHDEKELFFDRENGFVYRNSVTMPILQIGELAKSLSEGCRTEMVGVPWKEISGMRDVFAHHYGSIDYEIVWKTSRTDIQDLQNAVFERLNRGN